MMEKDKNCHTRNRRKSKKSGKNASFFFKVSGWGVVVVVVVVVEHRSAEQICLNDDINGYQSGAIRGVGLAGLVG